MKTRTPFILVFILSGSTLASQNKIVSGRIINDRNNPIEYANVYIEKSMEGTSSGEEGLFKLETSQEGIVTLVVSMIGFEDYFLEGEVSSMKDIAIILKESPLSIDEVVVQVGHFMLRGTSAIEKKGVIDLVTAAGSEGDLFKAISMLPGAQVAGTDGRLIIRGGNSSESQTYIDDMHVLSSYGASAPGHQARGRYSPLFFSGINFSMGGFSSEYAQSLSSVLPLYTKDEVSDSKIGINLMNVSVGGGGTQAWEKSSLSLNFDYGNLDGYNKVFYPTHHKIWNKAIQFYSIQKQFRYNPKKDMHLKTFYSFNKTTFNRNQKPPFENAREMDFNENNLYLNTTYRYKTASGLHYFAGVAYGWNSNSILGAKVANDALRESESELHLKAKLDKRISNFYKISFGVENFMKRYSLDYMNVTEVNPSFNHNISGVYAMNDFNLTPKLLLNASARSEYTSLNRSFSFLPRMAISYQMSDLVLSGVIGRYQQMSSTEFLIHNNRLSNERNWQYQIGGYYQKKNKILRVELYYKRYGNLVTKEQRQFLSEGFGYSKGLDLFFSDQLLFNHWDYTVSYSLNDSKRRYLDYPYMVHPNYVTKHNASVGIRYTNLTSLRSIIAISARMASGRPFDNPNEEKIQNGRTSPFYTTDVSWTFLAHKKLIVYVSASNVFNRKNIYGYDYNMLHDHQGRYDRKAIKLEQPQAFYIGLFFTLGKNVAYEASHF